MNDANLPHVRQTGPAVLVFGDFQLDPEQRRLLRDGAVVALGSRAMALLLELAQRPGEVLSRNRLEASIWPCMVVEDSSLRAHIAAVRKALGGGHYIANVPRRGYCFVGSVELRPKLLSANAGNEVLASSASPVGPLRRSGCSGSQTASSRLPDAVSERAGAQDPPIPAG